MSRTCSLLVGVALTIMAVDAAAMISSAPATLPSGANLSLLGAALNAVQGCPERGGLLDSVSVPVGDPLDLAVVLIGGVAPEGGVTYRLSSDDASIVAAGDRRQGFLPQVTIPEGQSASNNFTVFGLKVGRTTLRAQSLTAGYGGFAVPLGAWDVGAGGNNKFLDANGSEKPCRVSNDSPDLSSDENTLADCGVTVAGVATDGVSRLLMRTQSGLPGTACYEIVSTSSADQGMVETAVKASTPVNSLEQASSYYRAPQAFEESADSRVVEVEFTFTPSIGNGNTTRFQAETTLVRPPVVLVHGVWSDSGAWLDFFIRNDQTHTTHVGNYRDSNDDSFSENVSEVQDFIAEAVKTSRRKQYATTQADVLAHSMGGLLSRLYAQDNSYRRPENINDGDIHRLLALDTPHFGSNFANLLVALHNAKPDATETAVDNVVPGNPEVVNGAVCDLAENSPALQQLSGGTSLPAHVISATGGPAGSDASPADFWGGVAGQSNFEAELTKTDCVRRDIFFHCVEREPVFPQDIVDGHRFRERNDAIVPLSSQLGGILLASNTSDNFPNLLHFGVNKLGITFVPGPTNTEAVADRALALLDEAATSDAWAGSFPGVLADGTGAPRTVPGIPGDQDADVFSAQCAPGKPMKPGVQNNQVVALRSAAALAGDPRVRVVSPADGQSVTPGETVTIIVQIEAPLVANDIKVRLPGLGHLEGTDYDGSTYKASLVIPETFVGPITIIPIITDENGTRIEGSSVTIAVPSTESPERIYLVERTHFLKLSGGKQTQLAVIGVYAGDVQRNISSSAAGTTYISSDPGVVTASAEGKLTPVGVGTAVVTVKNQGSKDFAMVEVTQDGEALPAESVIEALQIQRSGFRLDRRTGFFVQQVRLANEGDIPMPGPLYMVLGGLPGNVELINKDGTTQSLAPLGSPYLRVPLSDDGLTVQPGQTVNLLLQFLNPDRRRINYDLEVFRTSAEP